MHQPKITINLSTAPQTLNQIPLLGVGVTNNNTTTPSPNVARLMTPSAVTQIGTNTLGVSPKPVDPITRALKATHSKTLQIRVNNTKVQIRILCHHRGRPNVAARGEVATGAPAVAVGPIEMGEQILITVKQNSLLGGNKMQVAIRMQGRVKAGCNRNLAANRVRILATAKDSNLASRQGRIMGSNLTSSLGRIMGSNLTSTSREVGVRSLVGIIKEVIMVRKR